MKAVDSRPKNAHTHPHLVYSFGWVYRPPLTTTTKNHLGSVFQGKNPPCPLRLLHLWREGPAKSVLLSLVGEPDSSPGLKCNPVTPQFKQSRAYLKIQSPVSNPDL